MSARSKGAPRRTPAAPARLTRAETQAQTRERLLDAAARAFAADGYVGASVDAIALDAGFTKGAFYASFDSKADIFLALLARQKEAPLQELETLGRGEASYDQYLEAIERWLDGFVADGTWAMLSVELIRLGAREPALAKEMARMHTTTVERVTAALAALVAKGKARPPMPLPELAELVTALTHGLALNVVAGKAGAGGSPSVGKQVTQLLRSVVPRGRG